MGSVAMMPCSCKVFLAALAVATAGLFGLMWMAWNGAMDGPPGRTDKEGQEEVFEPLE